MFEIDDEDGFWEKLPLDGHDEFKGQSKLPCLVSIEDDVHFPTGSKNMTSGLSKKSLSDDFHTLTSVQSSSNVTGGMLPGDRSQLAQIHNVITKNRKLDRSTILSSSKSESSDLSCSRRLSKEDQFESADFSKHLAAIQTSSTHKPGSKRKFPGPAGILPDSIPGDLNKLQSDSPVAVKDPANNEAFPSSSPQPSSTCDPFTSNLWQFLLSDIGPDAKSVLKKFAIKAMLLKASKRELPKGKIPLVLAFIESVDFHGCDGTAVLRDPSGKVNGALHNDLVKDPSTAIKPGCVIVLRQTSVISPTPRTHYLNVTPANIVVIYNQRRNSSQVYKSPWSPTVLSSSSDTTILPLPQIIQDSVKELTSAINNPQTPQHTSGPRLGSSNSSQMSLFGSVTNNSPSFPLRNRFPTTNTANTPINNRFKSPISPRTFSPSTCPPPSSQRNPVSNVTNSFQPKIPTPQNHLSSTHALGNSKFQMGNKIVHKQPSTFNYQSTSSFSHTNHVQYPPKSTNKLSSAKSFPATFTSSEKPSSVQHDEFFDDDSDLLSLCDDSNMMFNKSIPVSNQNLNLNGSMKTIYDHEEKSAEVFSEKQNISSGDGKNELLNFRNLTDYSSGSKKSESVIGISKGITPVAHNTLPQNDRSSVQHRKFGSDIKSTTRRTLSDVNFEGNVDVRKDCGRAAGVQLGVTKSSSLQTTGQAQSFGTWDDDLDDELLSQL